MYLITNLLTQPQSIGEETLPAGEQIAVESVTKRMRGLAERGFVLIQKVEEDVFDQTPAKPAETKPTVNNSKKEQK